MAETAEPVSVPFFKKSRTRPSTSRRRDPSPTSTAPQGQPAPSQVILPSRKHVSNLLSTGSKRSLSERDDDASADSSSFNVNWSSGATSHTQAAQQIIEGDEVEELIAKRTRLAPPTDDATLDDGLYHGSANYKKHLKKSEDTPKSLRVGPQRSNASTIRTVTITDYQPDVCKDYKETGFCGFGDTCKFLHDRGTYLAGWQLDKLAANPQPSSNNNADDSDSDSDEDIPFACFICKNPYTDPVVTRCGHYFCSSCAIKRFSKTPKCAACGAPTGGIFNRADKVIEKLNKKQPQDERDLEDAPDEGGNNVQLEIGGANTDESDSDSNDSDG